MSVNLGFQGHQSEVAFRLLATRHNPRDSRRMMLKQSRASLTQQPLRSILIVKAAENDLPLFFSIPAQGEIGERTRRLTDLEKLVEDDFGNQLGVRLCVGMIRFCTACDDAVGICKGTGWSPVLLNPSFY